MVIRGAEERQFDMRAGNSETPFTLMNVKLIAIDLRYGHT